MDSSRSQASSATSWSAWTLAPLQLSWTLQKRLLKFLLKRSLGPFLQEELNLDQLDVELAQGQFQLEDLQLNAQALNNALVGFPLVVKRGHIGRVLVTLPSLQELWSGDCRVQVEHLHLECVLLNDLPSTESSALTSMYESVHSDLLDSVHMAGDFLQEEAEQRQKEEQEAQNIADRENEGLQVLTTFIEKLLARLRIHFKHTEVYLHRSWLPTDSSPSHQEESQSVFRLFLPDFYFCDETPTEASFQSEKTTLPILKVLKLNGFDLCWKAKESANFRSLIQSSSVEESFLRYKFLPVGLGKVTVDCFIKHIAICSNAKDLKALQQLYSSWMSSNVLIQEYQLQHLSSLTSTTTTNEDDANLVHINVHISTVDAYLVANQIDAMDHSQFFITLFYGDVESSDAMKHDSRNNNKNYSWHIGKWMHVDHLHLQAKNMTLSVSESEMRIKVLHLVGEEWLSSEPRFTGAQPGICRFSKPSGTYSPIIQFSSELISYTSGLASQSFFDYVPKQHDHLADCEIYIPFSGPSRATRIQFQCALAVADLGLYDRYHEYLQNILQNNIEHRSSFDKKTNLLLTVPFVKLILLTPDMRDVNNSKDLEASRRNAFLRKEAVVLECENLEVTSCPDELQGKIHSLKLLLQSADGSEYNLIAEIKASTVNQSSPFFYFNLIRKHPIVDEQRHFVPIEQIDVTKIGRSSESIHQLQSMLSEIQRLSRIGLYQADMVINNLSKEIYGRLQLIVNEFTLWEPLEPLGPPTLHLSTSGSLVTNLACVMNFNKVEVTCSTQNASYNLLVHDLSMFYFEGVGGSKNDTFVVVNAMEIVFSDLTTNEDIFTRTIPPNSLTFTRRSPIVLSSFRIRYDSAANIRESDVALGLHGLTWCHSLKSSWYSEMSDFLRTEPLDIVLPDSLHRLTKVKVGLSEVSIDYKPLNIESRAVVLISDGHLATTLVMGNKAQCIYFDATLIDFYLIDSPENLKPISDAPRPLDRQSSSDHFTGLGFTHVLVVNDANLKLDSSASTMDLTLSWRAMCLTACADSFQTFVELLTYKIAGKDYPSLSEPARSGTCTPESEYFSDTSLYYDKIDVDEEIYRPKPTAPSEQQPSDGLSDSFEIIDDFFGNERGTSRKNESPDWVISQSDQVLEASQPSVEVEEPIVLIEDHFALAEINSPDKEVKTVPPTFTFRILDSDLRIVMCSGYDWKENQQDAFVMNYSKGKQAASDPLSSDSFDGPAVEIVLDENQEFGFIEREYYDDSASDTADDNDSLLRATVATLDTSNDVDQSASSYGRSLKNRMEAILVGFKIDYQKLQAGFRSVSKFLIAVKDVDVIDMIESSLWHKFLTILKPETEDEAFVRPSNFPMLRFQMEGIKPDLGRDEIEYRLKIRILPLRLHVDQDAMNFLLTYFSFKPSAAKRDSLSRGTSPKTKEPLTFIQLCDIDSLMIKIDYKPKKFNIKNLSKGMSSELMNIFQLEGSRLNLRPLRLAGINGFTNLFGAIGQNWIPPITGSQLPNVLGGMMPVRSLVQIGSGMADLILIPLEQYQKDGRLVKGLQQGARRFIQKAATESLKLGTKLAVGTQVLLEQADSIFNQNQTASSSRRSRSIYSQPPATVMEGLENAFQSLSSNINTAVRTIIAIPMEVQESNGEGGFRSVIRAIPVAVLRPLIGASEAVRSTLIGMQNSIDPARLVQMSDKYRP